MIRISCNSKLIFLNTSHYRPINLFYIVVSDRLCGLVVRVPGYKSWGPGSIPDATRFSEKHWIWSSPLSLVSTNEELLGKNCSGSGLENREYGRGDPLRSPLTTLTTPTSGGRSVCIVGSWTKATEFGLVLYYST
jgi:hypothetical protein